MDGKLLVLCGERPTINKNGSRIDENRNLLRKEDGKYFDIHGKQIEVDEHKKVISGMDLLNPIMTESTEPDILYVDWETIIPSDIEELQEMVQYSQTTTPIPPKMILGSEKDESIMRKAHIERLMSIDKYGERPSFDYRFLAMEDFMQMFSDSISNNGIVSILPAMQNDEEPEINRARYRIMETLKNRMEMRAEIYNEDKVEILETFNYDTYGEVYIKSIDEMMKIMSKPDFYETSINDDNDEHEGR